MSVSNPEQSLKCVKVTTLGPRTLLGECFLISSLPGKALRTLVDIAIQHPFSKPGKLDIKTYFSYFCVDSASLATSFKKFNVIMT